MIHGMRNVFRKANIVLSVFFAGMFICLAAVTISAAAYSNNIHAEITSEIMRLHVYANSDSPEDQARKFYVREAVLAEIGGWLSGDEDLNETRAVLENRLPDIERIASGLSGYPAKAVITREYLPTRTYGGFTLPAGVYETLSITIGAASGRNWWCVVFPPLCMGLADTLSEQPDGEITELKNILSDESYSIVSRPDSVRFKFKAVEIWQGMRNFFANTSSAQQ
ncbi:MAG: stage II sporulation protein R [Defluviitaleaceae bacterium]|nr:stage II sporulation protein R [Defluviitaleaceae bacterium]